MCLTGLVYAQNLTANVTIDSCPVVTFVCDAQNIQSISLYWFFNEAIQPFAVYGIAKTVFPRTVEPFDERLAAQLGNVKVLIFEARLNQTDRRRATFVSTLTVDIAVLQRANISTISCGNYVTAPTIPVLYSALG